MPNALTRHVGLNAGGWVLETLLKHYLDQLFSSRPVDARNAKAGGSGDLQRDELMYAEVFHIVKVCGNSSECFAPLLMSNFKSFLDASTQ